MLAAFRGSRHRVLPLVSALVASALPIGVAQAGVADAPLLWRASLRGEVVCRYGDPGCNRCVDNVEDQFSYFTRNKIVSEYSRTGVTFELPEPPWDDPIEDFDNIQLGGAHFQGMARIPYAYPSLPEPPNDYWGDSFHPIWPHEATGSWYALSMGNENVEPTGIALIWMAEKFRDGGAKVTPQGKLGTVLYWYQTPVAAGKKDHIGGISAIGKYLVGALDQYGPKTSLDVFDLSKPMEIDWRGGKNFQSVPIGSMGATRTAAVGVTRLANGKYLMASADTTKCKQTQKPDDVRSPCKFHYFVGSSLDDVSDFKLVGQEEVIYVGESATLLNECGTGRVYVLSGGGYDDIEDALGVNIWYLGELQMPDGQTPVYRHVSASANPVVDQNGCQTRGPSSAYATPDGDLTLVCHEQYPGQADPSHWEMSEWTPLHLGEIVQE